MPTEASTEQTERERGLGAFVPEWNVLFVKAVPDSEEGNGSIVASVYIKQDGTVERECEAPEDALESAMLAVINYRAIYLPEGSVLRLVTLHQHIRRAWEKGYETLKDWEARGWSKKANVKEWCGLLATLRQNDLTINATLEMSGVEAHILNVELREMISKFKLLRKYKRTL